MPGFGTHIGSVAYRAELSHRKSMYDITDSAPTSVRVAGINANTDTVSGTTRGACAIAEFASLTLARIAKYVPVSALEQHTFMRHAHHDARTKGNGRGIGVAYSWSANNLDLVDHIHTALKHSPSERVQHRMLVAIQALMRHPEVSNRLSEPRFEFDATLASLARSPRKEVAERATALLSALCI